MFSLCLFFLLAELCKNYSSDFFKQNSMVRCDIRAKKRIIIFWW